MTTSYAVQPEMKSKPACITVETMQYNTIQYNTMQCNAMQYNTIQHTTTQYNAVQCNASVSARPHHNLWESRIAFRKGPQKNGERAYLALYFYKAACRLNPGKVS